MHFNLREHTLSLYLLALEREIVLYVLLRFIASDDPLLSFDYLSLGYFIGFLLSRFISTFSLNVYSSRDGFFRFRLQNNILLYKKTLYVGSDDNRNTEPQ